jgi:hypothetical protein
MLAEIESYLSILEYLVLSFTLPVLTKRAQREIVSHPKFIFSTQAFFVLSPAFPRSVFTSTETWVSVII